MGKYKMTRTVSKKRNEKNSTLSPLTDTQINQLRYVFADVEIPFTGFKPFKAYDSLMYMNDYLNNKNLSWSDMKYPALALYAGSGVKSTAITSVSKNVEHLYD